MLQGQDVAAITALPKGRIEGLPVQADCSQLQSVACNRRDPFGELPRHRIARGVDEPGGARRSPLHGVSQGARPVPLNRVVRGASIRPHCIVCQ
jgi:hypothetical protein